MRKLNAENEKMFKTFNNKLVAMHTAGTAVITVRDLARETKKAKAKARSFMNWAERNGLVTRKPDENVLSGKRGRPSAVYAILGSAE